MTNWERKNCLFAMPTRNERVKASKMSMNMKFGKVDVTRETIGTKNGQRALWVVAVMTPSMNSGNQNSLRFCGWSPWGLRIEFDSPVPTNRENRNNFENDLTSTHIIMGDHRHLLNVCTTMIQFLTENIEKINKNMWENKQIARTTKGEHII